MTLRFAYLVICIVSLWNPAYSRQEPETLKPFTAVSMKTIEQSRAGQTFFVVLWALDCPPCRKELEMLGQLRRQHEGLPLVLISTDSVDQSAGVMAVLRKYSLVDADAWIFADSYAERLRHAIDPQWYGELPRSYFYDCNHSRKAVSGILKEEELKNWLRETEKKSARSCQQAGLELPSQ